MKDIKAITLDDVKAVMQKKGYELFAGGKPNIVGIRNAVRDSNEFDDVLFTWWEEVGAEVSHDYTITTHPGYYYLQNPIAGNGGTGILVPGQYKDCWMLGMHRQKQYALIQLAGQVKLYRDNNKDTRLDYDPKTIRSGFFGIDLHHAGQNDANVVGPYSAGCQVWRYHQPHINLMLDYKRLSKANNFNKFSYTLLLQEDFE